MKLTRRGFFKGLLLATAAALTSCVYAFAIEPGLRLRIQRWAISPKGWTAGKLRLAIVSDIHVGEPYVGLARLERIVAQVNRLEADLVLFLGDYAAGHKFVSKPVKIADAAPILGKAKGRLGTYAILGNHDWWDDRTAQKTGGYPNLYATALEAAGIPVLSNRAIKIGGFWLAGLEDQLALLRKEKGIIGLDDLPATLEHVTDDAPIILMAHEPDIFPKVPHQVALTLSGHTHGGQVRLFGWSPIVPSRFGGRFAYGHIVEDDRNLVVSGGIGCSILPVRFGVPPEITVVDLS